MGSWCRNTMFAYLEEVRFRDRQHNDANELRYRDSTQDLKKSSQQDKKKSKKKSNKGTIMKLMKVIVITIVMSQHVS